MIEEDLATLMIEDLVPARMVYYPTCSTKYCIHGKDPRHCKECKGNMVCIHGTRKGQCKECPPGSRLCPHNKQWKNCKKCGTYRTLAKGGFSKEEIQAIGNVPCCQFPFCDWTGTLCSDHFHDQDDEKRITKENYRGEICPQHNSVMGNFDAKPQDQTWSEHHREYASRRPYKEKA